MFFRSDHPGRGRAALWLPVLLCLAMAGTACSLIPGRDTGTGEGSIQVIPEAGSVRVVSGSESTTVRSPRTLSPGDSVEVEGEDAARLTAGAGRTLEIWGGRLEVLSSGRFRLLSGRVLVNTSSPVRIDAGNIQVSSRDATFRVDKQLATRVANYSGNLVKVALGRESLEIPAYRQVVTVQGILPKSVQPLRFSSADRWDRRLLSDAIDLDGRVANFAEGLEAQLGRTEGLDFFSKVAADDFGVDFLRRYLGSRRSDVLIGLLVATEATGLSGLSLDLRFDRIFALWNQGASWGLLAQEFGVASDALFGQLTRAVARAQIQVIGPGPALLQPPVRERRAPSRSVPRRREAPAAAPSPPAAAPRPAPAPALLPPPVAGAVPPGVKTIVEDLYGVVDPVTDLPPIL